MSDEGSQLIFSELIERHGRIRVPLIQRDYAQGRPDQDEVREEFLAALQEALQLPPDSEKLPLNLDFIYGSVEGESPSSFLPLDGQQRLTTLFLLHWYLAWRDQVSEDFQTLCSEQGVSRFSYQVRPSSKEFFDELVDYVPDEPPCEIEDLREHIQDQPWYFRSWRLDPTIQSSLAMLDAMHARFKDSEGLYSRITDVDQPAVTFQLLDLNNFGLSDDLYIKMNARGKPLTAFETFKARYEQMLAEQFPEETRPSRGQEVRIPEYFARQMDTSWADFFWPHRDRESHVFDAAVMNLFRAMIIVTRPTESLSFSKDVASLRSRFNKNSYHFFQKNGWLDRGFAEALIQLLDAWSDRGEGGVPLLPDDRYFNEKGILKQILTEPTRLRYEDLIQFSAYVQFLQSNGVSPDPEAFQEWMRVIFNLSVNTEYNRVQDFERALASVRGLKEKMNGILEFLADTESDVAGFYQPQVNEEQRKAALVLRDTSWRALIDEAEAHGYFRGQIGFLLYFSGALVDSDDESAQVDTNQLQGLFSDYLSKAKTMFGGHGLNSLADYRWERALLSIGNYMLRDRRNLSFLVDARDDKVSWKRLLRWASIGSDKGRVLKQLWDGLSVENDVTEQLDSMIANASGLEPWRQALVDHPEAIDYCGQRRIRFYSPDWIYLLRKMQLNGAHAELFTYCFYKAVLQPADEAGQYQNLSFGYVETNSSDDLPGVWLRGLYRGESETFFLSFQSGQFLIWKRSPDPVSDELSALLIEMKFETKGEQCIRYCDPDSIKKAIIELDRKLVEVSEDQKGA